MKVKEMAYAIWPILAERATGQRRIFYSDLADMIGIHPRPVYMGLDLIQTHCIDHNMPPLTVLVVSKDTGKPGAGFNRNYCPDLNQGLREVSNYNWDQEENPF